MECWLRRSPEYAVVGQSSFSSAFGSAEPMGLYRLQLCCMALGAGGGRAGALWVWGHRPAGGTCASVRVTERLAGYGRGVIGAKRPGRFRPGSA